MRLVPTLLAAAALLAPAVPGARAASSDAFDGLVAELEIRRPGLEGSADPRSILQLRALDRSLEAIHRADTLSGDCRAAGRVADLLGRAFPSEFLEPPPLAAPLSAFVGEVFQGLVDRLYRVRGDLLDRAEGLRPRTAFRVRRAVDAADARLDRGLRATRWRDQALLFAAAAAALERGSRIADADPIK